MKPTGYHVLIEVKTVEETTASGIILPQETRNREQAAMTTGTVLEFGPACFKNMSSGVDSPADWGVSVGDTIVFPKHVVLKLNETQGLLVDHEIKCVLNEE